jgi:hypothetical protein
MKYLAQGFPRAAEPNTVPSPAGRAEADGIGEPGGRGPLMGRCSFVKGNGERCKGAAISPLGLCWSHDPENAERRSRMPSRAARSKPNKELSRLKAQLQELTSDVLAGEIETARAAVANQLLNTRLRALELGRKIRESDNVEARLEVLEDALHSLDRQGSVVLHGRTSWGA